ncbi:MAG: hypothetical protein HYX34_09640 [Actinobacteria bacterium]|nr:hypothetical protein [Actinomycetota bacterium]
MSPPGGARIGLLFAAGSLVVAVVARWAPWFRRRLSFPVVALGALVVSGLSLAALAYTRWFVPAVLLWASYGGFGLLLNINTGALRQAIVPNEMLGRIMSIAGVLAWSAIPLGALAGAALINATGDVRVVYFGMGVLSAAIAAAFAFSPIRRAERYLDEAAVPPGEATGTAPVPARPDPADVGPVAGS